MRKSFESFDESFRNRNDIKPLKKCPPATKQVNVQICIPHHCPDSITFLCSKLLSIQKGTLYVTINNESHLVGALFYSMLLGKILYALALQTTSSTGSLKIFYFKFGGSCRHDSGCFWRFAPTFWEGVRTYVSLYECRLSGGDTQTLPAIIKFV